MHPRELPIPPPRSVKHTRRAAEFLIDTYLAATDEIVLVPVGPLTNIALAIRLEPRIVERIPRTVIMGGAHESGNTTPSAEFNIWVDPEAAQVVLRAGLANLTLIPLDATHRALVSAADCERLRATGTPAAAAAAAIIEGRIAAYDDLQPMEVSGAGAGPRRAVRRLPRRSGAWSAAAAVHVDVETRGRADGRADGDGYCTAGSGSPRMRSSRSTPMPRSSCRYCWRPSPASDSSGVVNTRSSCTALVWSRRSSSNGMWQLIR